MALPDDAVIPRDFADPTDVLDWYFDLSGTTLEPGEAVESYVLTPSAEFVALGGQIMSGGDRDPVLVNAFTKLKFWVEFDEESQQDPAFDSPGATLGITLTIVTNNIPFRKHQKTLGIKVKQR